MPLKVKKHALHQIPRDGPAGMGMATEDPE
jgi:hypothetical protein